MAPAETKRFEGTYEEDILIQDVEITDIDELKRQLGQGGIEKTLIAMNGKMNNLQAVSSNRNPEPGEYSVNPPLASTTFDPTEDDSA